MMEGSRRNDTGRATLPAVLIGAMTDLRFAY
jgi:hypothetical protein